MWLFIGIAVMAVIGFILRPLSSLLAMAKFLAFAVAAVAGFVWYMGGPADLYAAPTILGALAWIGLMFVPQPRFG
ncbi:MULTISPECIES: hypothetical protein [Micrococcus]|uniref:hypothetical protein n=1 Tax=Micrococcus TaxID=1269 RepID=UPI001E57BE0C|nr:hypothetical protein [Micrococcus luteus]MCD0182456.1 hypothetical protein [Micrococcus luteus]